MVLWALMSKRSVGKGDEGKKTAAGVQEAKPQVLSPTPLKKKAKSNSAARLWQNNDILIYAGLIVAAAVSLFLRTYYNWKLVFTDNGVVFSSETDAWYHMMLARGVVINHQRLWFDPMTNFPNGTTLHFGPFHSWAIALVSEILGLGNPSMHLVDTVGAIMPAVLGALLVFPIYFIGRELAGKSCGLISALIIAVIPGQVFSRTTLGFTDHHAAEILLSTVAMMFLLMALRSGRRMTFDSLKDDWSKFKSPLIFSALSGLFLGLYIDAWSSGFLFVGVILFFVFWQSIFDHMKGKSVDYLGIIAAIAFIVAIIPILPFVKPYYGFNHYYYSLFQPTSLLIGAAAALVFALLSRYLNQKGLKRYYYPGSIAVATLIGTGILYIAIPQFTRPLLAGLSIFQQKTGGAATIGEASPLFANVNNVLTWFPGIGWIEGIFSFHTNSMIALLLTTFTFALVALLLLAFRNIWRQRPVDIAVLSWSLIMLVMVLAQNRFGYYYGINVAVLTAFLVVYILQKLGIEDMDLDIANLKDPSRLVRSNLKTIAAAIFIFALIILPSMSWSTVYARGASGPESDWLTSTAWLKDNTPSPGMELYEKYQYPASGKYEYPDSAYGIMSWWDYGHLIEVVGHRIPNANPFQQGIGSVTQNTPGSSPFFLAENESQAEKVLAELDQNRSRYMNTKYVMVDQQMATGKFHAMAAWSGISNSNYLGGFLQEQGGEYGQFQIWREPYFKSMTARMFFFDGSEMAGNQGIGLSYKGVEMEEGVIVPVLTEAPKISSNFTELEEFVRTSKEKGYMAEIGSTSPAVSAIPLEALQHFRLVHESETPVTSSGQKWVKIFENVPGAVVKGSAPAGTPVMASIDVQTNQNRMFEYRQSNVSNSDGQFTLVLPYSTEGPISGGTQFDTKAGGNYTLYVGNVVYGLRVPEEYVLAGASINI
ncbi:MAG: dolichyl-phosphooligosaccharide-protein glycotransferase [Euryarchaeota archaeon]|jgi:dolichyl-diphosphooligosaccharide--protein glycosyltransferase|nr:dolichyl-phosphooligosaccharide-protein glycotransferase [Euryarchaeota archaeon]